MMFLFCNEDKKKKERLNSVLKTTHNLIKKNDIKDVRKNPVYSLIRAMSNYHLYDIVRELYEDEEVTDVQSIYKDIGVSWNDLFTFVIMLMAILTYIDTHRKHKK